jgi:hypothetical protein
MAGRKRAREGRRREGEEEVPDVRQALEEDLLSVPELQVLAARLAAVEARLQTTLDVVDGLIVTEGGDKVADKERIDAIVQRALAVPHREPDLSWSSALYPPGSTVSTVFPPHVASKDEIDHAARLRDFDAHRRAAETALLQTDGARPVSAADALLSLFEEEDEELEVPDK